MKMLAAALGLCLFTLIASADVPDVWYPEDGTWRNPAAPGRNFKIDVQDDVLILNVFGYKADGSAVWYQAANGWTEHQATQTKVFDATLNEYKDGQCVGCPYTKPVLVGSNGGSISITFTGPAKALVNWEGDKFNIERSSVVVGKPPHNWLGTWVAVFEIISAHSDFWQITDYAGPTSTPGSLGVVTGFGSYDYPVGIECFGGAEAGALNGQCIAITLEPDTKEIHYIYSITEFGVNNGSGAWHDDGEYDFYDYPAWFKRMAGATDTIENNQPEGAALEQIAPKSMRRAAIDAEMARETRLQTTADPVRASAVDRLRVLLLGTTWQ